MTETILFKTKSILVGVGLLSIERIQHFKSETALHYQRFWKIAHGARISQ